jgi:hypothetical protein
MREALSPPAQRRGVWSGAAVAILCLLYGTVLAVGFITLPSPDHPVQQPWLTLMEALILAIAPAMVALMVAIHAWAPQELKPNALAGVAFMSLCAGVTCAVHFAILTLSRQTAFAGEPWQRLVFSFQWPSVVYALDVLAWDVFFPLAAWFAATTLQGRGSVRVARGLLFAGAVLAFLGLAGVFLANMQVRNIGILGYAVLFPIAAAILAFHFRRGTLCADRR